MRARVAYISSLGTTAILVAAALLMLVVVGTIVAFRGWPGGAGDSGVRAVPLGASPAAASRVAFVRRSGKASVHGLTRSTGAHAVAARASTAGLVKTVATGPTAVPGLVMVAAPSASMEPHAPGALSTPPGQPHPATPPGAPQPPVPDPAAAPPVPDVGQALPGVAQISPPASSPSPPSSGDLTAMAGQILSGGPPPPGALAGLARVRSAVR
jgi:hypothetical protein